jgi:hypothetical protein
MLEEKLEKTESSVDANQGKRKSEKVPKGLLS